MPTFYPSVSPDFMAWCAKQKVFWTASAPLRGDHINVSPKALLSSAFTFLGPNSAAYVDLTGSGVETIAHLKENGRITIMFNSFDAGPRVLRLFCKGRVVEKGADKFDEWLDRFGEDAEEKFKAVRSVIVLDIFKVQTSCGFGVPLLSMSAGDDETPPKPCLIDRPTILKMGAHAVSAGKLAEFQATYNGYSLDGLPGLSSAAAARRSKAGAVWYAATAAAQAWAPPRDVCVLLAGVVLGVAATVAAVTSGRWVPVQAL